MKDKYILDNLIVFGIAILATIMTVFSDLGYFGLIALYVIYRHIKKQQKKEIE